MNDFFSKIPFHSKWLEKNNKIKQPIERCSATSLGLPNVPNLNALEYQKKYYDLNKDEILEKRKIEYNKNKQKKKEYYQKNKERILEKQKIEYQKKINNNI